ncbi:hypothetical protein Tco_0906096, partial [Tanacetum coccineum]
MTDQDVEEAGRSRTISLEYVFVLLSLFATTRYILNTAQETGTDISQKDEEPSKKRQNRTRDGKVCEDEAQSKSSQL